MTTVSWLIPKSFWASDREIMTLKSELEKMKPLWSGIRCPVWVIHAEDDRLVDYRNVDYARRMLVNAAVQYDTMPQGDHFILWSERRRVEKAVLRYFVGR